MKNEHMNDNNKRKKDNLEVLDLNNFGKSENQQAILETEETQEKKRKDTNVVSKKKEVLS